MVIDDMALLRLLHLADSALPIGATAHSYGLETLVDQELLSVEQLEAFLKDLLMESGMLEAVFCRHGYRLATEDNGPAFTDQWLTLNAQVSAFKTARESRAASATLGRRLLQLAVTMEEQPLLREAIRAGKANLTDTHYCLAFGLIGSVLKIDIRAVVLAYLQQSLMGLVSACQRLLPLGQSQASLLLWRLKATIVEVVERSEKLVQGDEELSLFALLPELGSMRHPTLTTRLFIS